MAILVKFATYLLVLAVGIGVGFESLSLLDVWDMAGRPGHAPPAAADAPASGDDQGKAAASGAQETSVFQIFTNRFAGWFVSVDCVKNRRQENGVAFGSDYLIHFANRSVARFVTGGYHHISADTIEFASDDDDSELYTIDHDAIFLSGIKINKVVIQQPESDQATKSSFKMMPCTPWNKGKPDELLPAAPYSDTDGLRMAIQVGDGEAAIGFLAHGASLPPRDLESLLATSTVPEASKVNIKGQNRSNAEAAASDKK